ncbi:YidH family protein [Acidipila sp. EB88]|uniref:YidH family protein n=1 Tax=Acidipila sp. EB88 TaxID=2305226 RepID=UPI000F5E4EE4|nr:DUF202 domain-containing protein [Acidipila sp. EB88]RRA50393.1 DUF202 domain-containing protein [Acidipila sp. EB88]
MPEAHEDPRIYFAAERTFLAWLRTGLGLMGIGFAVSRFGLFLRQIHLGSNLPLHSTGVSVYSGVSLVMLGVIVNIAAVAYHVRTIRRLQTGTWEPGLSMNAVVLALLLAAIGLGMAIFLLVLR